MQTAYIDILFFAGMVFHGVAQHVIKIKSLDDREAVFLSHAGYIINCACFVKRVSGLIEELKSE